MKKLILIIALAGAPFYAGCPVTTPATKTAEYKTLASVGLSAQAGMDTAAQLLKAGTISVAKFQTVASFYDNNFQPVYKLAVTIARSDLTLIANPDVVAVSSQLATLVAQLTAK